MQLPCEQVRYCDCIRLDGPTALSSAMRELPTNVVDVIRNVPAHLGGLDAIG